MNAYLGEVVRSQPGVGAWVRVPAIDPKAELGPCEAPAGVPPVGARVLVNEVTGSPGTYVIAGGAAAGAVPDHTHTPEQINGLEPWLTGHRLDQLQPPTAPLSMNGQRLTGLPMPVGLDDAATKEYVDDQLLASQDASLISNGSFEELAPNASWPSGYSYFWKTPNESTHTVTTTQTAPLDGYRALRVIMAPGGGTQSIQPPAVPVRPGQRVTITAWVRRASSTAATFAVHAVEGTSASIGPFSPDNLAEAWNGGPAITVEGSWVRFDFTYTVSNVASTWFGVRFEVGSAGAAIVDVDSVVITSRTSAHSAEGNRFTDVLDPVDAQDAANKVYVDAGDASPFIQLSRRNGDQSIANATFTDIAWNTTDVNEGGTGIFTTPSGVLTVQKPGIYTVTANVVWAGVSGGRRIIQLYKNAVVAAAATPRQDVYPSTAAATSMSVTGTFVCQAGDTLRLRVYQQLTTAANLAVLSTGETILQCTRTGGRST